MMQKARQQARPTIPTHAVRELHRTRNSAVTSAHPAEGYAGNQATLCRLSRTTPQLQCKLQIGAVNDPLEAEADRVAEQVMRMSDPNVSVAPSLSQVSRKCAGCEEEEDKKLHAKPDGAPLPGEAPPIVYQVLSSPGRPLDSATRAFMEPRFGQRMREQFRPPPAAAGKPQAKLTIAEPGDAHERQAESTANEVLLGDAGGGARSYDFSGVRIHTDNTAAASAAAMQARAYTVGSDMVFGEGYYRPQTPEGRALIAHELTHVAQQGSASVDRSIQRDMIYAGAYKSPYGGDPAEIASATAKTWYPSTVDFAATTATSGGGSGASSFDDLIKWIASQSKGAIAKLGLVGHASASVFGLSGDVTVSPMDVTFTAPGQISTTTIAAKLSSITPVRDRFASGAKIILYGCHAGVGTPLLAALSNAFGVCVEGFSDEIWWCIHWTGAKIDSRGRTWMDTAGLMGAGLLVPDCLTTFDADISKLKPDKSDCSGVPAASPKGSKESAEGEETPTPLTEEP
jgi:Domain of unknown function (DUF4157)